MPSRHSHLLAKHHRSGSMNPVDSPGGVVRRSHCRVTKVPYRFQGPAETAISRGLRFSRSLSRRVAPSVAAESSNQTWPIDHDAPSEALSQSGAEARRAAFGHSSARMSHLLHQLWKTFRRNVLSRPSRRWLIKDGNRCVMLLLQSQILACRSSFSRPAQGSVATLCRTVREMQSAADLRP